MTLHFDMDPDAYHADPHDRPSLSSTLARVILNRSPAHARAAHPRLNPRFESKDTATFDIGRAAHSLVLGRGGGFFAYPEQYLASNGAASTKEAKAWAAEVREAGGTPLKASDVDMIHEMAHAVQEKMSGAGMKIDPARSEIVALAEIDGCPVRAMIDNAPEAAPYLLDFKTTTDASPEGCIHAVSKYGYDVQVAHYLSTWKAATGEDRRMRFVFAEKEPPFGVGIVELHAAPGDEADWLDDAYGKCAEARRLWSRCLKADHWPGYPARVAVIGAPGWYRNKWETHATPEIEDKPSKEALDRARKWQSPEGLNA